MHPEHATILATGNQARRFVEVAGLDPAHRPDGPLLGFTYLRHRAQRSGQRDNQAWGN
jgi:hypothetical protein